MSHSVTIRNVVKKYGSFCAVDHISLDIEAGEFFTLLGPSGCGKTTLLRMIAGFNTIDAGSILFDENEINHIEAYKRGIGMVFQNYAIFPHMTVYDNVAYGLKAHKIPAEEIPEKVDAALELMQISQLKDRRPSEMSGGQQQRIALARAIVIEPDVLLMDEPLSNLDAKLRVTMRWEIKKLQRRLGITTIYVTHDQEEALSISDRIAVMKDGHIMQVGEPKDIYLKPQNPFVSGFIGTSNFLSCSCSKTHDFSKTPSLIEGKELVELPLKKAFAGDALVSVRPEQCSFGLDGGLHGIITLATFLGDFISYEVTLDDGKTIEVNEYTKETQEIRPVGENVHVHFVPRLVSVYAKDSGEVLSL
ncbi:MAG: ABC transporter ATP-binding protein [Sphaerochaetaceae bacterium]